MNTDRFLNLSLPERARWLYFNGELVTSIRYYKHKINLYMLENMYVEVFYNFKEDRVEQIVPLDHSSSRMNFYADQIKLPERMF